MFSSSKILMASRPRYQMGSDIVLSGTGGGMCMNADGTVVAVFSRTQNNNNLVEVRRWNGSSWIQVGLSWEVSSSFPSLRPGGFCLDGSGNTLVIGIPDIFEPDTGTGGEVVVLHWDGSSWTSRGFVSNPMPGTIGFGSSASLSRDGMRLAVGAVDDRSPNVSNPAPPSPFVAIYDWNAPVVGEDPGRQWTLERIIPGGCFEQAGWDASGRLFSDMTGRAVSLSSDGGSVAYGSMGPNGLGNLTVSTLNCNTCGPDSTALFFNDAPSSDSRTDNPISVSLSGDGSTVAISDEFYIHELDIAMPPRTTVYRNNGQSWDELGSENILLGRTRLSHDGNVAATSEGLSYRWDGSSWTKLGGKMVPIGFFGDCAISDDGTVVAVGDEVNGNYVCRVFKWN